MKKIEIDLEVHRAIEAARTSFDQSANDILRNLVVEQAEGRARQPPANAGRHSAGKVESAIPIGSRTTGKWSVECKGVTYIARNLREAYITAIARIVDHDPGVFEILSQDGNRRKFVARRPEELYPHSRHLAEKHRNNWYRLGDWYVDLNLSRAQAAKRVRRACALVGLAYGTDLTVKENLSAL